MELTLLKHDWMLSGNYSNTNTNGVIHEFEYPTSDGITKYPHFLWFNLTEPNLIMTIIAASMYFIQPLVNSIHYPKDQRKHIM